MITLKNGVKIDETTWDSPNYWAGRPSGITGVTIHWWGKPEWNQRFDQVAKYLCEKRYDSFGNEVSTSAHYVVSDDRVACLVSPTNRAWHALSGNEQTIGLELDPNGSEKTLENAAQLIAWLEDYFDKSLNVYPHHYWTSTECPGKYSDKIGWLADRANAIHKGATQKQSGLIHLEPVTGYPVTQKFGAGADLSSNLGGGHTGIDYGCPAGTPALALEAGTVLWADWAANLPRTSWEARWYIVGGGYQGLSTDAGIVVVIDHGNYLSTYSHMAETKLNPGDTVVQGQEVGKTGYTGYTYGNGVFGMNNPAGAHLHFECLPKPFQWGNGYYGRVNPAPYFTQTVEKNNRLASAAVLRAELEKEKKELSILTDKVRNELTGGQTDLGTEVSWLPKNFQRVFEGISNIRLEIMNQKIMKLGDTQRKGETTTLATEVAYNADNFKRVFNSLDAVNQRLAAIDARLAKIESK